MCIHIKPLKDMCNSISNRIPTNENWLSTFFLQNDNKMTKTCAKEGGRETLKDGIILKLQRHIVSQRKLLIVIHLFSSRFMTNDYWNLLCYRLTFTCVSEPRGSLLVDFYMFRKLCHNLTTMHLLLMMFTLVWSETHHHFRKKVLLANFDTKGPHTQKH